MTRCAGCARRWPATAGSVRCRSWPAPRPSSPSRCAAGAGPVTRRRHGSSWPRRPAPRRSWGCRCCPARSPGYGQSTHRRLLTGRGCARRVRPGCSPWAGGPRGCGTARGWPSWRCCWPIPARRSPRSSWPAGCPSRRSPIRFWTRPPSGPTGSGSPSWTGRWIGPPPAVTPPLRTTWRLSGPRWWPSSSAPPGWPAARGGSPMRPSGRGSTLPARSARRWTGSWSPTRKPAATCSARCAPASAASTSPTADRTAPFAGNERLLGRRNHEEARHADDLLHGPGQRVELVDATAAGRGWAARRWEAGGRFTAPGRPGAGRAAAGLAGRLARRLRADPIGPLAPAPRRPPRPVGAGRTPPAPHRLELVVPMTAHPGRRGSNPSANCDTAGSSEGGVVVRVDLFADPACMWSWLTSRWLVEVAPQRGLQVRLRGYSLLLRDGAEGLEAWKAALWGASHRAVRVMQALQADHPDGVRGFYEALITQSLAADNAGGPPFQDLPGALAAA